MIKKKKTTPQSNNSQTNELLAQVVASQQTILSNQQDLNDRIDDIEKKSGDGGARLLIAERMFNTDSEHLPELTIMPLRAVRPYSRAMAAASIMDDEVQKGKKSLATIRREAVFRLMRSVKGNFAEKGVRLAEQQAASEGEKGEEYSAGQGL